jgi:hypothetical protein
MFEDLEFKKVMNVPYAVIISSFIIIIITVNMTDVNGLSALISGYSGLFLGILFVIIINSVFGKASYLEMFPLVMVMIIAGLTISYLGIYFDRIAKGEISNYYSSFSLLSLIFLATQVGIIFSSIYGMSQSQDKSTKIFSDTTFSLLGLLSVINILIVLTMGIVLHFYSTQG